MPSDAQPARGRVWGKASGSFLLSRLLPISPSAPPRRQHTQPRFPTDTLLLCQGLPGFLFWPPMCFQSKAKRDRAQGQSSGLPRGALSPG